MCPRRHVPGGGAGGAVWSVTRQRVACRFGSAWRMVMDSAPDLRERNVGLVFDVFDADRDGYITEDDMVAVGRGTLDEFGVTDAGLRAEALGLYQPV